MKIGSDDNVICEVINARKLILTFNSVVIPSYNDDIITTLRVGEGSLSLFDEIVIPIDSKVNSVYKIKKIGKSAITERGYILYSSEETKTTQFILPLISDKDKTKEYFLIDTFFENAYIAVDKSIPIEVDTDSILALLYRYSESEIYRAFESRIRKHPMFIKTIDINKSQVLFLFNTSEIRRDIQLFKIGAYSQLGDKSKQKILNFYGYKITDIMGQILTKSAILRKQLEIAYDTYIDKKIELYSKPIIEEETYGHT